MADNSRIPIIDLAEKTKLSRDIINYRIKKLTKEGVVVTSIPNVRYYRNYIDFALKGNWDYRDAGTLDKTHLRFFTYNSILKMFEHLGFEVLLIEGIHATRNKKLRLLNFLLFKALEDLKYLHFVTVARPRKE